jgi:ABC-type phosphate transport system auxiliary subunit
MWDMAKQQQLDYLQRRQIEGELNAEEQQSLAYLYSELEQQEWGVLRPALGRLRAEQQELQKTYGRLNSENTLLAAVAERQEDLLERARTVLGALLDEHKAIQDAYERIIRHP